MPSEEASYDLDNLIITWFCWLDEGIKDILGEGRLRARGAAKDEASVQAIARTARLLRIPEYAAECWLATRSHQFVEDPREWLASSRPG